ncbi:MAG TPA: TetR/AcrR family transcriptional regulator [Gemmatimonadales bacterium]|nr:TetR/AcrR family transcriptional regulator [Gemmatimonadales bacterium]
MRATTKPRRRDRGRNAARTQAVILDAAERLFAEKGFEETSLAEVGRLADVSRATPGYFFGSKGSLHRAVLERCFEDIRRAVREGKERALASGQTPDVILAGAVADYADFIAARPNFVRLIEREALSDRRVLDGMPLRSAVWQEALAAFRQELGLDISDTTEAAHLLLSLVALTWFPIVHGRTFLKAVGLDPGAPEFGDQRKRHITTLLLGALRERAAFTSGIPS